MDQEAKLTRFNEVRLVLVLCLFLSPIGCDGEVTGEAFDPVRECWGGSKSFDTGEFFAGCDDSVSYGEDSSGGIWRFRNSCIGDDLTPVSFYDNGYPDCPAPGLGFVEVNQRRVDIEAMCVGPWEFYDRVPEDDPCVSEGPELYRFGNSAQDYSLFPNGCNTSISKPLGDVTVEEVLMFPECSE